MKYENASDILPEGLLKEIQKYASGKLLYVPSGEEKKTWGEMSGYRNQLQRRNQMIRNKYAHGVTVTELADEYYLSLDSIKRIIYSKKQQHYSVYAPTIESAIHYAHAGMLMEWCTSYCLLTNKSYPHAEHFNQEDTLYFGVIKFPLRLIQTEIDNAVTHTSEEVVPSTVPLLIEYKNGKFYCITQHSLLVHLKRQKVNAYSSIVILQESAEYKRYMQYYGNVFMYANK